MQPLFKRKIKMFFIYWINEARGIFPKSFNEVIRALFLLLISLFITNQTLGSAALEQKLEKGSIDFLSLSALVLLYIIIHFLFVSPFLAHSRIKRLGFWDANTFYYHHKQLIYTGVIHPVDQGIITVKFPLECKNSLVDTETVVNGAIERVKAGFTLMKKNGRWDIQMKNGISRTSIRLNGNEQYLIIESLPNTIPTRVQVFLESWTE